MDTATIDLIKTIITDAVKILGPASIAAYATFKVSKTQFELKIKELEKTHEFGAREHLFQYFKERQSKLEQDYNKLNESLGYILGFTADYSEKEEKKNNSFIQVMNDSLEMYSKIIPVEIQVIARDMKGIGLDETPDYEKLMSYKRSIDKIDTDNSLEALQKNIFTLLEIYHFLQYCNQILIQNQIDKIFHKYIDT